MKDLLSKHASKIGLTLALILGIVIVFNAFLADNDRRITSQNEEYLDELTTQREVSVDSMLSENLSYIKTTAYLFGQSMGDGEVDVDMIGDYEANAAFDYLRFIDSKGDDYTSEGIMANLADRAYFKAGMKGKSGIMYVLESRVTGESQIGFYAPVRHKDQVVGVMVGFYGEAFIQRILEYELFGAAGEGWLVADDGTVIGSTVEMSQDNYIQYLQRQDTYSRAELDRIKTAFALGKEVTYTYGKGKRETSGHAVPLENADWMLIRTFPATASQQILDNANGEGIVLIIRLIVLFLIYGIILAVGVIVSNRRERAVNRDANDVSSGVSTLFDRFVVVDLEEGAYRYVAGSDPVDDGLPATGDYDRFCAVLLGRISDDAQRLDIEAYMRPANLQQVLADTDRTSLRVHAPVAGAQWFTYNFIVLERREGNAVRLLVVCQDVTELAEQEAAEQERLQRALDAAEKASQAKTEFLFNMSHDLRTPMNAIIGYTELARRDGVSAEQTGDFLEKIDSSSHHLLALINDILEMSRVESGKMVLDPVDTDLTAVIREAEEMFATQMAEKNIQFTVDASGVRDPWVSCDAHRLDRVVLNLLSNAYKFTEEGGQVQLTLTQEPAREHGSTEAAEVPGTEMAGSTNVAADARAEATGGKAAEVLAAGGAAEMPEATDTVEQTASAVSATDRTGHYVLRVKDTGIGMSPEFAEKIFAPFERERTSTVSGIQGTGLGMSITKSIVDVMGGEISLETQQGVGTEFIVRLAFPVLAQEEAAPAGEAEAAQAAAGAAVQSRTDAGARTEGGRPAQSKIHAGARADGTTEGEGAPIDAGTGQSGVAAAGKNKIDTGGRKTGDGGEATDEAEAPAIDFTTIRLLLVEDNDINREIARMILEQAGFTLELAENGQIAVDKVTEAEPGHFDAVLMDIQMPVMDGYTAARTIRALEDPDRAAVPIIAMTANAFKEDEDAARDAGMQAHITKPLDVQKMLATITEVLAAARK